MSDLLLRDLAIVTAARLQLADLPPLQGDLEAIHHIDFDLRTLQPGGLFWDLCRNNPSEPCRPETAFLKGACGVLVQDGHVEPWAGRYTLHVDNSQLALRHLGQFLKEQRSHRVVTVSQALATAPFFSALRDLAATPGLVRSHSHNQTPEPLAVANTADLSVNILSTDRPPSPYLDAKLVLAGPHVLVTGQDQGDLMQDQTPVCIHRMIEALLPAGGLLYCNLPPFSKRQSTAPLPPSPEPSWLQLFREAGIHCLHLGASDRADLRVTRSHHDDEHFHLSCDRFSLTCTNLTNAQSPAVIAAFGLALLLGHEPTDAACRLGLVDRSRPLIASSVISLPSSSSTAPRIID